MSEFEAQELRASARIELDVRVHIHDMAGRENVLLSHDWGENSVFLRTHAPLPPGSLIEGFVVIPDHPAPAEIRGVVVRTVKLGDPTHHRPPGMALHLTVYPDVLKRHVATMARSHAIHAPQLLGTMVPTVMLVGLARAQATALVHALDEARLELGEAEHIAGARALVEHGVSPDVLITRGDLDSDLLLREVESLSANRQPQLAIQIGGAAHIERPLRYPIVVLPEDASAQAVHSLIRLFVHPQRVAFETTVPPVVENVRPRA